MHKSHNITAFSTVSSFPARRPRVRSSKCDNVTTAQAIAAPPRPSKVRTTKKFVPVSPKPNASPSITDFGAGFVSVKEIHHDIPLKILGKLPGYLDGNMYRVGPGIFDIEHADGKPADKLHWFDGIGVVFKFALDGTNNRASFMCRSICPEQERAIRATAKHEYKDFSFGAIPTPDGPLAALRKLLRPLTKDPVTGDIPMNINVTLEQIPGRPGLVARSDFSRNIQLDPDTLDHTGTFDFANLNPQLRGMASAAHSAMDEETGELFNFAAGDWKSPGKYRVFRVAADGNTQVLAEIKARANCHVHSLTLTKRFVVIAISPWSVDLPTMAMDCALAPSMRFNESKKTEFFVISRQQKRVVARFETQAFAAFHYVNAFEEENDDKLHVDVCRYDQADVLEQFYLDNLRSKNADWFTPVRPVRYTMHGSRAAELEGRFHHGIAAYNVISEKRMDLPAVNDAVVGKKYRYCYGVSNEPGGDNVLANAVVKLDTRTGASLSWTEPRTCVGEPTFVADPEGTDEDDGVLLVVVMDVRRKTSALVVLDAGTMKEIARAETPQTVPHAFHGLYIGRESESKAEMLH